MLDISNKPISMGLGKYIAMENAIEHHLGKLCAMFGKGVFIIGGKTALSKTRDAISNSLSQAELDFTFRQFAGFCSMNNINLLKKEVDDYGANLLVAVGGGKVIDTTKAVAFYLKLPVITVPTIAATCAAWAPLSVVYSEQHVPVGGLNTYAPEFVVCDYSVLFQNSKRFFAAGIGDSLAKWPELGVGTDIKPFYASGIELAKYLFEQCLQIAVDVSKNISNLTFEKDLIPTITDLVIPITGLVSELTSGAMGGSDLPLVAHGIDNGLLAASEKTHNFLHGERVTFGLIPHLLINKFSKDLIQKVLDFVYKLRLPLELKYFGLDQSIIPLLSEKVYEAPGIKEAGIVPSQIAETLYEYQELVQEYKKSF